MKSATDRVASEVPAAATKLAGSCHCGAVRFRLRSAHPYPFMRCYCSICRKTAGTGGYAINLSGDAASLKVKGRKEVAVYRARLFDAATGRKRRSSARRHFCRRCGSALWLWDPQWPELVHPHAGAIDSDLPAPPELVHMMLDSKAGWVPLRLGRRDGRFEAYPTESIAQWHERLGLAPGGPPQAGSV